MQLIPLHRPKSADYEIKPISRVTTQEEPVYRITARGFGYTQRTQVVLQTIFVPLQE